MAFDIESMKARFHEVADQVDAIEATSLPLREARDAHVNAAREVENAMNAEIKAAEAQLPALKDELAFLAKGLGGKTGPRPNVSE